MLSLLVYFVIAIIICSFAYWAVTNFIPEPGRKFGILLIALVAVIFVVYLLLGMVGGNLALPHVR